MDFGKVKKELEEQKKRNNEQAYVSDERTRMAKLNKFEEKVGITLTFSFISYIVLSFISAMVLKNIGAAAFIKIFPSFSFPVLLIGGSLGIGAITKKIIDKKFKIKERLKAFSTAKNQSDKLEEEIYYQIELEKAINRNSVIDQALSLINSNESRLRETFSRYDNKEENIPRTKEEIKQRMEELSNLLKEKYNELDKATTKKVLRDRFWGIRIKGNKFLNTLKVSVLSSVLAPFFLSVPFILIRDAIVLNPLLIGIVPQILGLVGAIGYMLKRNKDYKKVFDRINSKLGDDALEDKEDYDEQRALNASIENIKRDVSVTEIQLKEQQIAFEAIKNDTVEQIDDTNSKELNQVITTYTIDENQDDRTQENVVKLVKRKPKSNDPKKNDRK